jgi:DNA-binding HxlR family transcriptional regulator
VRRRPGAVSAQVDKGREPVVPAREPMWPKSSRAIAKEMKISPETMDRTLRRLEADGEIERRIRVTGRDGKSYPLE